VKVGQTAGRVSYLLISLPHHLILYAVDRVDGFATDTLFRRLGNGITFVQT